MAKVNDFSFLVNFIEEKIGLFNNKDFFARRLKNKTKEMPRPENFMRISLPTKGFDEKTKQKKLDFFMVELEKLNLNPTPTGKRILIEIPKTIDHSRNVERVQSPKLNLEPIEVYQRRFKELKELHEKLPIFGIANRDQPDIGKGVVYFNYFDNEEAQKALKLFLEIEFGVEERKEKECNLTFVLMLDSIDTTNLPLGRGKLNGNTINIFLWVIKKIYRKVIESLPEGIVSGISGRGVIDCGEPEIFQIKNELEEKFGIIMLIHMSAKKRSEFFILTTPEAIEIFQRFKGKINSCDLIKILKSPETEAEIKNEYLPKNETMNEKRELSSTLLEILKKADLKLSQGKNKEPYLQISRKELNKVKIAIIHGTPGERENLISVARIAILGFSETAIIESGKKGGDTITVSIPGYVSTPLTKRKKVVAEKPTETTPKMVIPGLTTTNEVLPVFDAILSGRKLEYSEEELQLKKLVEDPESFKMLDHEVASEIHNYFIKKRVNEHAKFLLAKLQNKS